MSESRRFGPSTRDFPRERPDFEPAPDWARPATGASGQGQGPGAGPGAPGNGLPGQRPPTSPYAGRPLGYPSGPNGPFGPPGAGQAAQPGGRTFRRRSVIVLLAIVALLFGALGAAAGTFATMKYGSTLATEPVPPPKDDLGRAGAFPKPQNVSKVAASLLPSVVQIKTTTATAKATGSGFVIKSDGHILTNNHVVAMAANSGSITVGFEDGREATATIIGRSPSYDLAVIKINGVKHLRPVAFGDSNDLTVGQPVVAVGAPLGLHGTVTSGIVSAKNRPVTAGGDESSAEPSFINAIQTDAAINPGNSGGPLVDLNARVIGVNSAIATLGSQSNPFGGQQQESGSIGLGFSIPINQARRTADQLMKSGHAVYPVIGAGVDTQYAGAGAKVSSVEPGGSAESAGLRMGDLLTRINGHPVTDGDDLIVQIRTYLPGQNIQVTYKRDGQERNVRVHLGSKIDSD